MIRPAIAFDLRYDAGSATAFPRVAIQDHAGVRGNGDLDACSDVFGAVSTPWSYRANRDGGGDTAAGSRMLRLGNHRASLSPLMGVGQGDPPVDVAVQTAKTPAFSRGSPVEHGRR